MGELSKRWGRHMAESPITDIAERAMAGDTDTEVDLAAIIGLLTTEVAVIHQTLLNMTVAVDALFGAIVEPGPE
jgi:hypothetical protein